MIYLWVSIIVMWFHRFVNFAHPMMEKTLERFAHLLSIRLKEGFPLDHIKLTVDKPRYTKKLGLREIQVEVER